MTKRILEDLPFQNRSTKLKGKQTMKKRTILEKTKPILCLCLIIVCITALFGCERSQENPYSEKECIECGETAKYYTTSPTKPLTENEKCYKKLDSHSIYKIFYCEKCWDEFLKTQY